MRKSNSFSPKSLHDTEVITRHRYLDQYPISPGSEKLLLGTIHPHDDSKFLIPFFYGNKLSLWQILNEAFPGELGTPISLKGILAFLQRHKISVSDVIVECRRIRNSARDEDLVPIVLNSGLTDQIRNSGIREIYFTSGFGKNSAFRLFYEKLLHLKITGAIRANRGITLDEHIFGRPVKLTVLISPSGSSNIGTSRSKAYLDTKDKYRDSVRPVLDFKRDYYRENFL